MSDRALHIHTARVYLAQAAAVRHYPQQSWWHATLLRWAANQRRKAAAMSNTPTQGDLFA